MAFRQSRLAENARVVRTSLRDLLVARRSNKQKPDSDTQLFLCELSVLCGEHFGLIHRFTTENIEVVTGSDWFYTRSESVLLIL